jgi:hypothetical protein
MEDPFQVPQTVAIPPLSLSFQRDRPSRAVSSQEYPYARICTFGLLRTLANELVNGPAHLYLERGSICTAPLFRPVICAGNNTKHVDWPTNPSGHTRHTDTDRQLHQCEGRPFRGQHDFSGVSRQMMRYLWPQGKFSSPRVPEHSASRREVWPPGTGSEAVPHR